jgi:myo-inositol-1(or 4)-monophosphatase
MTDIMRVAIDAARETGELLLDRRGRICSVEAKDDRSLVTDVDREVETLIRRRIAAAFPPHGILGEEGGGAFVAGVIGIPAEGLLYTAERGAGAFVNGDRITVSARSDPGSLSIGLDSELRTGFAGKARVLEELGRSVFNVRMLGSSARSLSLVAEGRLDGLVEFFDKPWDFAAGGADAHRWLLDRVRSSH